MDWDSARKEAMERDQYLCQRCLHLACDVHHRVTKGMGGTKNEYIAFGLANLVSLCRECHTWVHANPAEAYRQGFLVHSWEDPAEIPIGRHPDDWLF